MEAKLTQMDYETISSLRWAALDAGDERLYWACEGELERRDIEDGALILLAA